MYKILTLLIFATSTTLCFGQSELNGTWTLDSYTIDSGEGIEVKDKLKKDKLTFDKDGRYQKTYYDAELPEGARHQMSYNLLDGKVVDKYFDKNGYEIKVVRVSKRIDNGTYEKIDGTSEIRFLTEKASYAKICKVEGQFLLIADTLNNSVIWRRYKKKA